MPTGLGSLIEGNATELSAQSLDAGSSLDALKDVLRIAFEAAVFSDWFEIDEQGPLSRLEALTEELLRAANSPAKGGASGGEDVVTRAAATGIVREVSMRVRASIK
jgi:hypothetical protein